MTTPLFFLPAQTALDSNGDPISGAKLYAYAAGTLSAQDTYTDTALSVAHANPVVADAGGQFAAIFLQNLQYRFILKTSADVEVWDIDDYAPFPSTGLGSDSLSKSTNYQLLTSDRDKFVDVTGSSTITLPTLADAGTGWAIGIINSGVGIVTVDGSGAETVNGVASNYLQPGASIILTNDGNGWFGPRMETHGRLWVTPYTVADTDSLNLIAIAAGSGTVTLPVAATIGSGYRTWLFNKNASSAFTIDGDGTEEIDGRTTAQLDIGQIAMLLCDGSKWHSFRTPVEQVRVKTADETVNTSATLQDDDDLADFLISAGVYYGWEALIVYDSGTTPDIKLAFTASQTPQVFYWSFATTVSTATTASGTAAMAAGQGLATYVALHIRGSMLAHATTAGTLKLQWAQNTSDASDTTIYKGSWMKVFPLG